MLGVEVSFTFDLCTAAGGHPVLPQPSLERGEEAGRREGGEREEGGRE